MKGLCAIISGGEYSPMDDIKAAEYIIACDRGYSYAKRSGIVPDLLLGDFDSYTGKLPEGAAVERLPREKDDTDTMHAVRRALELGFTRISLYCALGGARSAGAAVQPRLRGVYLLRRERPHPGARGLLAVGAVALRPVHGREHHRCQVPGRARDDNKPLPYRHEQRVARRGTHKP